MFFKARKRKKISTKFFEVKKNQVIDPISSTLSVQGHAPFYS
jgi:hypothetical protein